LAAGLVRQAEEWTFGGLYNWLGGRCGIKLAKWPVPRLPNWLERVNRVVSEKEKSSSNGSSRGDNRSAKAVGSHQLLVESILNRAYESEVAQEIYPCCQLGSRPVLLQLNNLKRGFLKQFLGKIE